MKQKLCLGNCYALTKHKLHQLNIRNFSLLAVLTIMCLYAVKQVSAQGAEPAATAVADIKPLQIGDTLPDYLWNLPLRVVNHPEGRDTIMLNDYKGKLIILDFWATWCGSCLAAMPKVIQLQSEFLEKIMIFPVTYERSDIINTFLKTNRIGRELQLSSITGDSVLRQTFPHRLIPHYVWISPKSTVLSTTNSDEVTRQNIEFALQTNTTAWNDKIDVNADLPLFLQTDWLKSNTIMHYSLLVKGKYEGLGKGVRRVYSAPLQVAGLSLTNQPLFEIYFAVAYDKLKAMGKSHISKRIILEFDDMSNFKRDYKSSVPYDSVYTYSIWTDSSSVSLHYDYLLEDLNRSTPYFGKIDIREIRCLELTKDSVKNRSLGTAKGLNLVPSERFIRKLNQLSRISKLIVDGTQQELLLNIPISSSTDLRSLQACLKEYGLLLIEKECPVDVFVISKH